MPETFTYDQVRTWLQGIAAGVLDLTRDNESMAQAALAYLAGVAPAPAPEPLPDGYLSPHFTLEEFVYSDTANAEGIDNTPDDETIGRLCELANMMETVRELCGDKPVFISSGYRCPDLNAAVGGADNSAHLYGCACDFTIPDFGDVLDVCHAIEPWLADLGVDQLIDETGGGARWVHIGRAIPPSTDPREECLTINATGTHAGIA